MLRDKRAEDAKIDELLGKSDLKLLLSRRFDSKSGPLWVEAGISLGENAPDWPGWRLLLGISLLMAEREDSPNVYSAYTQKIRRVRNLNIFFKKSESPYSAAISSTVWRIWQRYEFEPVMANKGNDFDQLDERDGLNDKRVDA